MVIRISDNEIESYRDGLLEMIRAIVVTREVKLSSGAISDFYIDLRRLTLDPRGSFLIANLISDKLKTTEFDAIGGLTIGADPIVGAICYHASLTGSGITGFLVRKEWKAHGMKRRIEGPDLKKGAKVILVDDVVTSGGSTLEAYNAVMKAGNDTIKAIAIVDREEGAREMIQSLGIGFEALITKSEIQKSNQTI